MPQSLVDDPPGASRFRLELLGGFRLTEGGRRLPLPSQARRLLAMIALNTKPVSRAFLAGTLWADTTEPKATAALRSALWKVRKHGDQIVASTSYDVALGPSVEVDVRSLAPKAKRLVDVDDDCDDFLLDPAPLSQDLLPGWYEDWVLIERESLRQLFMHALEAMAARLSSAGDTGGAIQACLSAIGHEPLRESAHRALILLYLSEGNVGEALRHADVFSERLAEEWGAEPSVELRRIIDPLTNRKQSRYGLQRY